MNHKMKMINVEQQNIKESESEVFIYDDEVFQKDNIIKYHILSAEAPVESELKGLILIIDIPEDKH